MEVASCDADEAIHVGDCPVNDVGGARNCNINAIWFNCEKKKWDEIFPCDLQAKNWKDLYEIISKNFILEKKMFNPFNMTKDMKGMEKMVNLPWRNL